MTESSELRDLFPPDILWACCIPAQTGKPHASTCKNADHILIVEHTNQGIEDSQGEKAYAFTVHYVIRHPKGEDREDYCPIEEHIEAVGIEDALGFGTGQLPDGSYELEYWSRRYTGPEGEDWDAGVNVRPRGDTE